MTNLQNQISKEATDVLSINNQLFLLFSSKTGDNNTFQNQIDILKNNQINDETNILNL